MLTRRVRFPEFLAAVLKSRRPELVAHLSPEAIAASGEPYASMMKGCGARSRIVVPLVARKRVLGTLMLVTSRSGPYDDSDVPSPRTSRAAPPWRSTTGASTRRCAPRAPSRTSFSRPSRTSFARRSTRCWAGRALLRQGRLDDARTASRSETIERNAFLQSQLVEDLLDLSQMVTGKLRVSVAVDRL